MIMSPAGGVRTPLLWRAQGRTTSFSTGSGLIAYVVAGCLLGAAPAGQRTRPASSGDLVELDVVALDRQDLPVAGLRQEEFQVKEDGRVVDIKTFAHVTTLGSTQPDDARLVTLLMDDVGVPMTGTYRMRAIAQVMFVRLTSQHTRSPVALRLAAVLNPSADDDFTGERAGVVEFIVQAPFWLRP